MPRQVARASTHVEPAGAVQTARHYIRELIYGANDGLITTFAVVAGVSGGGLPQHVVLIVGAANLFADGLSMAAGNYLAIRSHESVLEAQHRPEEEAFPRRHAMATLLAFVTAGTIPLFPYMIPGDPAVRFQLSIAFTLAALFLIGASRSLIGRVTWWLGGVEMLTLGAVVAAVAFASGSIVAAITGAVVTP
jgi:VIT1/CCC1 family predicted Fe2+/Mn2+ transporter